LLVRHKDLLVVDSGLREQHVPFMAFLLHFVLLLFAGGSSLTRVCDSKHDCPNDETDFARKL
jgi:hypothetical protein